MNIQEQSKVYRYILYHVPLGQMMYVFVVDSALIKQWRFREVNRAQHFPFFFCLGKQTKKRI